MESTKNYSNHLSEFNMRDAIYGGYICFRNINHFIILLALISLLIVSATRLFIYKITKSLVKKVIYNAAFIGLSVSDIRVALFSAPIRGMQEHYHRNCESTARHAIPFFNIFPYSFSCLFIIFIDRMFAITLAQRYTNLITKKIFKVIAKVLFLISATSSSILTTTKNILLFGFAIVSN